ncbi:MAG TPA: transporter [Candidatus Polarisedimenticolaceae bacterium]|nr:transporter [Candidatus Polarisedimenticolaceae bacterium]
MRPWAAALALGAFVPAAAQQLEPRAYSASPVQTTFAGAAYAHSSGDVVFDPSLLFTDVSARIHAVAPFYLRTFGLAGRQASVGVVVPYVWGTVEGNVQEEFRRADRSGFGDLAIRLAVGLTGAPALSPAEFRARTPGTFLGTSLTVTAPTGEYDPAKLVNLGTHRWAFKPELGLSHPIGKWWLEGYAGVWVFTHNDAFFGGQHRAQDPLGVAQAHVIRVLKPGLWAALNGTYYRGGSTTVEGVQNADRQANSRLGATVAVPLRRGQSLKLAAARGTSTRVGSALTTFGVTWQKVWMPRAG